ncbi:MAG: hypothetical protein ACK2U1_25615 [Anaerolineales bacterium]|jgi:hypothetical protein
MTHKFKESIRRTQAYWYVDGLVELGTGLVFILLGIILIIESITPADSNFSSILSFLRNAILIGGTIGIGLLTKVLKARLTYPRTGYIAYPRPKGKNIGIYLGFGFIIAALISGGFLFVISFVPAVQTMIIYLPTWIMVWLGILIASVYLSWAVRTGLRRFIWLAGIGLLTGLMLAWQARGLTFITGKSSLLAGPGFFFLIMGSCLLISGGLTLRNYLKSNQPINGETA